MKRSSPLRRHRKPLCLVAVCFLVLALSVVRASAQGAQQQQQFGNCCIPGQSVIDGKQFCTANIGLGNLTDPQRNNACKQAGGRHYDYTNYGLCSQICGAVLELDFCNRQTGVCGKTPIEGEVGYITPALCAQDCYPPTNVTVEESCVCIPEHDAQGRETGNARIECRTTARNTGNAPTAPADLWLRGIPRDVPLGDLPRAIVRAPDGNERQSVAPREFNTEDNERLILYQGLTGVPERGGTVEVPFRLMQPLADPNTRSTRPIAISASFTPSNDSDRSDNTASDSITTLREDCGLKYVEDRCVNKEDGTGQDRQFVYTVVVPAEFGHTYMRDQLDTECFEPGTVEAEPDGAEDDECTVDQQELSVNCDLGGYVDPDFGVPDDTWVTIRANVTNHCKEAGSEIKNIAVMDSEDLGQDDIPTNEVKRDAQACTPCGTCEFCVGEGGAPCDQQECEEWGGVNRNNVTYCEYIDEDRIPDDPTGDDVFRCFPRDTVCPVWYGCCDSRRQAGNLVMNYEYGGPTERRNAQGEVTFDLDGPRSPEFTRAKACFWGGRTELKQKDDRPFELERIDAARRACTPRNMQQMSFQPPNFGQVMNPLRPDYYCSHFITGARLQGDCPNYVGLPTQPLTNGTVMYRSAYAGGDAAPGLLSCRDKCNNSKSLGTMFIPARAGQPATCLAPVTARQGRDAGGTWFMAYAESRTADRCHEWCINQRLCDGGRT